MSQDGGPGRSLGDTARLLDIYTGKRREGTRAAQKAVADFLLTLPRWMHGFDKPETLQTVGHRFHAFLESC